MNKTLVSFSILILSGLSSFAQTSGTTNQLPHFSLPPIQLWQAAPEQEPIAKLSLAPVSEITQSASSQPMTLNNAVGDTEVQSRVVRPGQFYLIRNEPAEKPFVRAAEAIWSPEPVRMGKISVSCPVITAVKRKNLLCLLNPIFFQASW
jgi:hypothetical protein